MQVGGLPHVRTTRTALRCAGFRRRLSAVQPVMGAFTPLHPTWETPVHMGHTNRRFARIARTAPAGGGGGQQGSGQQAAGQQGQGQQGGAQPGNGNGGGQGGQGGQQGGGLGGNGDPGSGGGSGTGQQGAAGGNTDLGFPRHTPVDQMTPEQQAAYWKYQSRKHEDQVKQLNISSDELERLKKSDKDLQEIRDKGKSDLDKANEQLASAQVRISELETDNLRRHAATAAGLDADMAQFITAADADTAKQQAETLAQRMGTNGGNGSGQQQQQQQRQGAQYQQGTQNRGGQQASTVQSGRDLYQSRHGKSKQST